MSPNNKLLDRLSTDTKQLLSTLSGLVLLVIVFSLASPFFFTLKNLLTIALQTSIIAIISIGMTYVIITTGIDLSLGSVMALAAIVSSLCVNAGVPSLLAIGIGMIVGCICGLINGVVITFGDLPPFIVTMGMMSIVRGACMVITKGIPITGMPKSYSVYGSGFLFSNPEAGFQGIPVAVIVMIVFAVIFGWILAKTKLGRYTYAVGSNIESARLSGINTKAVIITVYTICGFLAAAGGIVLAGRIVSAQPAAAQGYELDAVAASVIGGTSQLGGEGMILGTIIGAFVIGTLRNGLNLIGISAFWQQIVIGVVIIGAVYFDRIKRRK